MNRRTLLQSLASAAALPLALESSAQAPNMNPDITPETVYELRIYHLNEGKLPLILDRFRTKETAIFKRLGMHPIAYWTPTADPGNGELAGRTLIYIVRHKSREAARDAWAKFRVDPEWIALQAATEKDGKFNIKNDSIFMQLTDFSPQI
jgi:NIPSNAP